MKNFFKNANLDALGISLPVSSRPNLKMKYSLTPKLVGKIIANLLSKAPGPGCISVKNVELELSYISTDLFLMCPKESCFPYF